MRSVPSKPGRGFIACREHILDDHAGTGKPANRSLCPSPKLVHADGNSIIPGLLADDIIRYTDISRPPPRTADGHVHVAFTFGPAVMLSCPKTFQGI